MRKVTGYIGALIIVMALMGSVLAGYALNINGTSAAVNDYEEVTDVSGLYSHTQDKTYLDYNPASNYIGYTTEPQSVENAVDDYNKFKDFTTGNVTISRTTLNAFNKSYDITAYNGILIWSPTFYLHHDSNGGMWFNGLGTNSYTNNFSMTRNADNSATVTIDGGTFTFTSTRTPCIYYPYNDYNYSRFWYSNSFYYAAYDSSIKILGSQNPSKPNGEQFFITGGGWEGLRFIPSGNYNNDAFSQHTISISDTSQPNNGIHYGGIQAYDLTVSGVNYHQEPYMVYVPRIVYTTNTLGIDYVQSSRVNNYPIEYENQDSQSVARTNINLYNVSLTNYSPGGRYYTGAVPGGTINGQSYTGDTYAGGSTKLYKLLDVLSTITVPENTNQIIFETGKQLVYVNGSIDLGTITNLAQMAQNTAVITTPVSGPTDPPTGLTNFSSRQLVNCDGFKAYYYPATGLVDVYNYSGVKLYTSAIGNTYVSFFGENNGRLSAYVNGTTHTGTWSYTTAPQAYLDITTVSDGSLEIVHYMDITKGVSIKSTNLAPVIWNNEYENGIINLLFRAETTYNTYSNTMVIGTDTITVDYTGGRFYVTLNSGEPVDIGTWRNIVLNIDLINRMVTVNPVRTFNSYTNVLVDNATISIGEMSSTAAPTNRIQWQTTPNSFTFNVYNTSVFLNTYGVVMVDPQLDITNYFTDLSGFYQLDMHNFSIYGDSITVNGVTGTVSGNTVTFGDESATLNKTKVTYADGHAYIEDSNVSIDLGEITDYNVILSGVWYFETTLLKGYTTLAQTYEWDWGEFIFNNTQFCVFYIGIALIGLIVARRFCILSVIDYAVFITSIIVALSLQVIA